MSRANIAKITRERFALDALSLLRDALAHGLGAPPPASKRTRKAPADATGSQTSSGAPGDGPTALAAVPAWMGDESAERAYLITKEHPVALENAVRAHGRHNARFRALAAERLQAITPADHSGCTLAHISAVRMVEAWSSAGPRPPVATQKARVA